MKVTKFGGDPLFASENSTDDCSCGCPENCGCTCNECQNNAAVGLVMKTNASTSLFAVASL